MSIVDIEEELGVRIPHSPEYDTIGGYIVHRAGSIPVKGWQFHMKSSISKCSAAMSVRSIRFRITGRTAEEE